MDAKEKTKNQPRRAKGFPIGRSAVFVLGFSLFLDLATRWIPIDRLSFRPWEAVTFNHPADAPFEPHKRYWSRFNYGDLASLGNVAEMRQYYETSFTTDNNGFRNPRSITDQGPPSQLLIGTSFSAGSGVNDNETLSMQLSRISGERVFNAAPIAGDIQTIRDLTRRLGMRRGVILLEFPATKTLDFSVPSKEGVYTRLKMLMLHNKFVRRVGGTFRRWFMGSRLIIITQKVLKRIHNDQILPNVYAKNVVKKKLVNGETMLFRHSDILISNEERDTRQAVEYWAWLSKELLGDEFRLIVLLVPERYMVYRPLIEGPETSLECDLKYFKSIEEGLLRENVAVINLTDVMRKEAERALGRGEYLYWRDDTHWNAKGVKVAAFEINTYLRKMYEEGHLRQYAQRMSE